MICRWGLGMLLTSAFSLVDPSSDASDGDCSIPSFSEIFDPRTPALFVQNRFFDPHVQCSEQKAPLIKQGHAPLLSVLLQIFGQLQYPGSD